MKWKIQENLAGAVQSIYIVSVQQGYVQHLISKPVFADRLVTEATGGDVRYSLSTKQESVYLRIMVYKHLSLD